MSRVLVVDDHATFREPLSFMFDREPEFEVVAGESLLSAEEVVALLRLAGQSRERDREAQRTIERLTPREREVLQALADGHSDKEISENLHVGVGTVRNHLVSVFGKLGVNSRLQALVFALRHGVVEIG